MYNDDTKIVIFPPESRTSLEKKYDLCTSNKRLCSGLPSDCFKSGNCQILAMAARSTLTADVEFELTGKVESGEWIAAGLSDDDIMGDDSVIDCSLSDGKVVLKHGFNVHPPAQNNIHIAP